MVSRDGALFASLRIARNRTRQARLGLRHAHPTASIHPSAEVARDLVTEEYAFVAAGCHVDPGVSIGRYSMLAPGVAIVGDDHVVDVPGTPMQFAGRPPQHRTVIGRDVWIGYRAVVRRGVTVGDGAIVGAHAVVTRNVAPYTVVMGVPARRVRDRFQSDEDVARHAEALAGPLFPPSFASRLSSEGGS